MGMKLYRILINCAFLWILASCCTINSHMSKMSPEYIGVAPKAALYVNEWLELAKKHKLKFDEEVTVGFKDIKRGPVVGLCNYGNGFREIDVDKKYWESSGDWSKKMVIFHELTHCYCDRGHDFGDGKKYPEAESLKVTNSKEDGFFEDSCALSIMSPVLPSNLCILMHYDQYVEEMFERCDPY